MKRKYKKYKYPDDPRGLTISQSNLSKGLGLTTGRISQLIQEGVVIRDEEDARGGVWLLESAKNYYQMKNSPAADEALDLNEERAKHEKVKREIAELKLAKLEANVYDAKTVELVLTEMLSNLRTQLLGLPTKLAPMLEGKSKEKIWDIMTVEIEEKLSELS